MLAIPVDGRADAFLPLATRLPAECTDLASVQGVAAVVSRAVCHVADERGVRSQVLDDEARQLDVLALLIRPDVVDTAGLSLAQDKLDRGAVVIDVQPVTHLTAVAVEWQELSIESVRREEREDLLRILVRAVRVRPARDGCVHAEGPYRRKHLQISSCLRRAVGARGPQWIVLTR